MKSAISIGGRNALRLTMVLAAVTASAADYYVSTSGSDANPGTAAQPFRTITQAYTRAGPGVTIHVLPGTYTDHSDGWGIHLSASGTAASPIVLRSEVVGAAIIDGQNVAGRTYGLYIDGDYNVVDGFEIRNCTNGISIASSGNQILNNHIHNNGNTASSDSNGRVGVFSNQGTSGNVYLANYIDHIGRAGSNLDHGLYLCGANELVLNNVLLANAAGGLQIAGYTTVNNMKVYNNVIAWNGTSGIILWMALNGVDIKNNIIYQNGHYGIGSWAATGSGVVVDNNLTYANSYGDLDFIGGGSTYTYSQAGNIAADPGLVDESAATFDPHLVVGSPAIQAGLNLYSTFTTDLAGEARPASGPWDLGVFVYGSATGDTTPPTVSLTAPANGATVSGTAVTVSANASDNVGVTRVQFRLDGANLGSAVTTPPYQVTWNTTQAANGSHTLSAVAYDAAGNQGTSGNISVTVNNADTTPPTVSLTAPANGATVSGTAVTVSANASDNVGVTRVQFRLDGTNLGSAVTTPPYQVAWDTTQAANGSHTLSAVAYDAAGNQGTSGNISVTVTNATPPPGTNLTFAATSGTISAPFAVNGTAISQPAYTTLVDSGQAVYTFSIPTAGNYVVSALVNAPTTDNNSFWVNIDAQPADPTMIWDVPVTTGFASQTVSWRGNGTVDRKSPSGFADQFSPKVFSLSAGTHQLIVRGREGGTQLGTITIAPTTLPAN
jgi:hypothetical protein